MCSQKKNSPPWERRDRVLYLLHNLPPTQPGQNLLAKWEVPVFEWRGQIVLLCDFSCISCLLPAPFKVRVSGLLGLCGEDRGENDKGWAEEREHKGQTEVAVENQDTERLPRALS